MALSENGDHHWEDLCTNVHSHDPRVNSGTCVNQNSSLAKLITAIDAFF